MVKLKLDIAKHFYHNNFSLVVYANGEKIAEGNLKSCPEIAEHFNDPNNSFYIRYQRRHRFLKYLAGQVFVGYFLSWSFALITLLFLAVILSVSSPWPLVWLPVMTFLVSLSAYRWRKHSQKRLTRSLKKYSKASE